MKKDIPDTFYTATEYAAMKLPGMPKTERGIQLLAKRKHCKSRPRKGRGGGLEYSTEILSDKARTAFVERLLHSQEKPEPAEKAVQEDMITLNAWQQENADKRLSIIREFFNVSKNLPPKKRTEFKRKFSEKHHIAYRTLENWLNAYSEGGYQALVPDWKSGKGKKSSITPKMKKFIERTFLQPLGPPVKQVHEDLCREFAEKCEKLPTYRTVQTFISHKWTKSQQLIIRNKDAWDRIYGPFVRRDWTKVSLNEVWISDHKQIDIACLHRGKVIFPWLTVVEEGLSRKFVGWILVPSPNALAIGQAFLYGVSQYGPPKTFYCDLGKDYQSSYIAGTKAKTDEDGNSLAPAIPGIVAQLGTEMFYACGRNPREKIIESAFGIFTDRLRSLPGYRGHSTKTRPKKLEREIKSKNLLTFDELSVKIDDLLNERNARPHSTTGKTPNSYWAAFQPVIPSQHVLDFLLMDVHIATVRDSCVIIKGLLYRGDELFKIAGERVEVRRDPKDIRRVVIVYKNQVFCSATLETPDHYRSEITLESVKTVAKIRQKIHKFRKQILESEDYIDDPLKLAVELDRKEKVRMRDIRPADTKITSLHKRENLARSVSDVLRKQDQEVGDSEGTETADAQLDILDRYLAATSGQKTLLH